MPGTASASTRVSLVNKKIGCFVKNNENKLNKICQSKTLKYFLHKKE